MRWLPNFKRTEITLFIITFCVFAMCTSARVIQQNDFNLLWFYILIYLTTLIIVVLGGVILHYIPFVPRIISPIIGSTFIIMICGLNIIPAILLTAMAFMIGNSWEISSRTNYSKIKLSISSVLIVILLVLMAVYLFKDGFYNEVPEVRQNIEDDVTYLTNDTKDYEIRHITYGSGKDWHRSEFANDVDIKTKTIDGSGLIENWDGFSGNYRTKYWGFNDSCLPLNGHIYMPKKDGVFPLVLIVHGDHAMQDYSELGYEYIAKTLANKGYIVASVDQNFLNRSWSDLLLTSPLQNDHATRGWLLLEHLKLWEQWNADTSSFLHNKIDMNNIALIGHSRGGEAVAIASAFNSLNALPGNPSIKFNYHFNIKSIIGVAPTDGFYQPAGHLIKLHDVNYLLLHGSHDGEMNYVGIGQYSRTTFSEKSDRIKAALYVFGANHSQFNTSWGSNDHEFFHPISSKWDYRLLMAKEKQQDIAKTTIFSFLEVTLKHKNWSIIRNLKTYLPKGFYLYQHQKAGEIICFDFENGNTELVSSENVTFKNKWITHGANTLVLSWKKQLDSEKENSVSFKVPSGAKIKNGNLRFDLANGSNFPIDFQIQVSYQNGERISFPLSKSGKILSGRFKRALKKLDYFTGTINSEIAFETFTFDMSEKNKDNTVSSIKFIFNKDEQGAIYLDNLGFE